MPVHLKGDFDNYLKMAYQSLAFIEHRMLVDDLRANTWSDEQREDLEILRVALWELANAVTLMAGAVRDD
jgi:hypothetical protein